MDEWVRFFEERLPKLATAPMWRVGRNARLTFPDFDWPNGKLNAEQSIALKHYLTDQWSRSENAKKLEFVRWIVADWGGVRRNSDDTLKRHLKRTLDGAVDTPLRGVASYSKVLSMADCNKFAIYDARVAACLNAAQLDFVNHEPIFFNYIPSQNAQLKLDKRLNNFVNRYSKAELVGNRGWKEVPKDESYGVYLGLLNALQAELPAYRIYHFEMMLFTEAPGYLGEIMVRDGEASSHKICHVA